MDAYMLWFWILIQFLVMFEICFYKIAHLYLKKYFLAGSLRALTLLLYLISLFGTLKTHWHLILNPFVFVNPNAV